MPESSCQQAVHPGGRPARRTLLPPPGKEAGGADISTEAALFLWSSWGGGGRHCSSSPFIRCGPWTVLGRAQILNTPKLRHGGHQTIRAVPNLTGKKKPIRGGVINPAVLLWLSNASLYKGKERYFTSN